MYEAMQVFRLEVLQNFAAENFLKYVPLVSLQIK